MPWLTFRSVCWLSVSFDVMFTSTSILHLLCMTVDRYIAICLPFKYHSYMSTFSVTTLVVICWCLPLIISFGLIFNDVHAIGMESYWDCPYGCLIFVANIYYVVICSFIIFYIPSLFMLVCNLKIFCEVRKKGRELCKLSKCIQREQHDKLMNRETKVARTIAIMLSCFFFCWLPFFVWNFAVTLFDNATVGGTVTWLGYINSTINPYLYYFLNKPKHARCCKRCLYALLNRSNRKKTRLYTV